jgi:hypothetical protein
MNVFEKLFERTKPRKLEKIAEPLFDMAYENKTLNINDIKKYKIEYSKSMLITTLAAGIGAILGNLYAIFSNLKWFDQEKTSDIIKNLIPAIKLYAGTLPETMLVMTIFGLVAYNLSINPCIKTLERCIEKYSNK